MLHTTLDNNVVIEDIPHAKLKSVYVERQVIKNKSRLHSIYQILDTGYNLDWLYSIDVNRCILQRKIFPIYYANHTFFVSLAFAPRCPFDA